MVRYWLDEDDEAPTEETGWLIAGTMYVGQDRREKLLRAKRFQEVELADATARHDDVGMASAEATLAVINRELRDGASGPLYARATRKRKRGPYAKR